MEFIWIHQVTSVMQLFMKASMLHHEVFPNSFHLKRWDEMGLACEKQERTEHRQHGGRRKPL